MLQLGFSFFMVSNRLFVARTAGAEQAAKQHPKVVIAEGFQLVDKEGNLRGIMGLSDNGAPMLGLYDEVGKVLWSAP